MTKTQRAAMQQALEVMTVALVELEERSSPYTRETHWGKDIGAAITALRAAQAEPEPEPVAWMFQHDETGRMNYVSNDGVNSPERFIATNPRYALVCALYTTPPARRSEPEPEPVADPFADIRGKRMSELNDEQADRARERCLRDQIDPRESYWYPHFQALFRIIDRLRAAPAEPEPVAWMDRFGSVVVGKGPYETFTTPLYTAQPTRRQHAEIASLKAERDALRALLRYWLPDETMIPAGHEAKWKESVAAIDAAREVDRDE